MAGLSISSLDISSYAQLLLSEQSHIALTISFLSMPVSELKLESKEEESTNNPPLTARQIEIAMASPFQPALMQVLHSLSHMGRLRLTLHLTADDIFSNKILDKNPLTIPSQLLKKATVVECDSILNKIDTQCGDIFEKYQTSLLAFIEMIIELTSEKIVALNDHEIHELSLPESVEDLQKRYIELNLNWPKIKYASLTTSNYLLLKTYVMIYCALGRLQKDSSSQAMQKHLKTLQGLIKEAGIEQHIQKLFEENKTYLTELLDPFQYTINKEKA